MLFFQQMQSEVDNLRIEGKRKDSNIDMVSTDKERVISRLKSGEGWCQTLLVCRLSQ